MTGNAQQVLEKAEQFRATRENLDWATFYREVLGANGIVRQTYPTLEDLVEFEQSDEYARIQQMLAELRSQRNADSLTQEPTRVITVRMPESLHTSLRAEAHEMNSSMNKLCISKLLQMVDTELVPKEGTSTQKTKAKAETTLMEQPATEANME